MKCQAELFKIGGVDFLRLLWYIWQMKKENMLSTKEAAELLKVSDQTIINWMRDGLFPNAIKLNPSKKNSPIRIPRKDIEQARLAQLKAARG